jgi:putative ABC transport system permease protein
MNPFLRFLLFFLHPLARPGGPAVPMILVTPNWVRRDKVIQMHARPVSFIVMTSFLGDLRIAARALLGQPALTAVAVLTLALGIGLAAAVFALVHGVLLTQPPYPHAERLVCVSCAKAGQHADGRCPAAGWVAWRNEARSFEAIAAYWWGFDYLIRQDGSQFLQGMDVTTNYFTCLGVKPLLGRVFLPSEISAPPAPVIILGYDLWQKIFQGDPRAIGQAVHISRRKEPLTIVGVMPPGLRFLPAVNDANEPNYDVDARVDYWRPAYLDESTLKKEECDVAGRMRPGVSLAQAQAELAAIATRHARAEGVSEAVIVKAQPLLSVLNRPGRRLLLPLAGAVALLFLIACSNVAGLLLARGLQQQREYAVRRALGARRAQLFSRAMAEPLLLSVVGGAGGAGLAMGIVKIIKAGGGAGIPRLDAVTVGWPVMASCLGLALAAAALAGFLPAWRAGRLNPAAVMGGGGRSGGLGRAERRLLAGAAVLQIMLTLVLLVGAALLVGTVGRLTGVNPGYTTKNILTMSVTTLADMDKFIAFHVRALERVSALPGVAKATFAWGLPLTGNKWTGPVTVEGQPEAGRFADNAIVAERAVTPGYFEMLRMNLVAGRDFRSTDDWNNWTNKAAPAPGDTPFVAIINQTMAEERFGGASPVGRKLLCEFWPKRPAEIIGVVADTRTEALTQKADPEVYFSYWQVPAFTKHLIVKAASDPHPLRAAVQRELRAIDPTVAVDHVKTLDQIRDDSIAPQRFAMRLLAAFALVGSVLALIGIHGVLSLSVHSRQREIAIRLAVGAQRRDVLGLVLGEGLKLIGLGLLAGMAVALVLARVLRAFLFGVGPADPMTFASVAVLFTAAALLACSVPARRATKTDPVTALRCE